jgi:glycosyltransferase involved in cell wall biosynthesis
VDRVICWGLPSTDLHPPGQRAAWGAGFEFRHPLRIVEGLATSPPVVFLESGIVLEPWFALRRQWGLDRSPVVGLTHSLSDPQLLCAAALPLALGAAAPWDAIVATSRSACAALHRLIEAAQDWMARLGHRPASPSIQTAVIPLPVADAPPPARAMGARQQLGLAESDVLLCCVGRFSGANKADLSVLLRSLVRANALDRERAYGLALAGDAHAAGYVQRLKDQIEQMGLGGQVAMMPNVTEDAKWSLLRESDIFLAPWDSIQESFGLAAVEAALAELPVVGADWNGLRETTEPGRTGLLVPTHWPDIEGLDGAAWSWMPSALSHLVQAQSVCVDESAMVEAILTLGRDLHLRRALGRAGRERALAHYSPSVVAARYRELFTALCSQAVAADEDAPYHPAPSLRRIFADHAQRAPLVGPVRATKDGRRAITGQRAVGIPEELAPLLPPAAIASVLFAGLGGAAVELETTAPAQTAFTTAWLRKHGLLAGGGEGAGVARNDSDE